MHPRENHPRGAEARRADRRSDAVGATRGFVFACLPALCLCASVVASVESSESIIPNGDFATADPADPRKPLAWQLPDGVGAKWVEVDGAKAVTLDTSVSEQAMNAAWQAVGLEDFVIPKAAEYAIAETYGLSYYSDAVAVEPGRAYRLTYACKGTPGGIKVWVRGYGELKGEVRRLYEAVVPAAGDGDGWRIVTQVVHPTKRKPDVREVKVMLYAYHPPATYEFRDVRLEPVEAEPSAPEPAKQQP